MTLHLSFPEIVLIAREAAGEDVIVADPGLLGSAITRPAMTVFGDDAYPRLATKAAALIESLARHHTLVDGNKRLAWTATVVLLRVNGLDLTYETVDEAETFVLQVAAAHLELSAIEEWIENRLVPLIGQS